MSESRDPPDARTRTDGSLRTERERSDAELLERSEALAENVDEIIRRARERARLVIELAREREDQKMARIESGADVVRIVREERRLEDAVLAAEHETADAQRFDERQRRQAAVLQLLALERDATDKMLAAERVASDRAVRNSEDLLSAAAHDLRNFLQTIFVRASTILLLPAPVTALECAASIQRTCAQMTSLVEDLLDFSRSAAGKLTLSRSNVDLVTLVRDAVNIHEASAAANEVTLAMQTTVDTLIVNVDGKRVTRVLINLIGNALKFTPAGGRIDVQVSVVDDACEISVRDTGIGIPLQDLEAIFERFQQGTSAAAGSYGVGLGLYIARLMTDAHGGRISAESDGSGSTFRVRLPRGSNSSSPDA